MNNYGRTRSRTAGSRKGFKKENVQRGVPMDAVMSIKGAAQSLMMPHKQR